jgi:hypothetical protein
LLDNALFTLEEWFWSEKDFCRGILHLRGPEKRVYREGCKQYIMNELITSVLLSLGGRHLHYLRVDATASGFKV